MTMADTIAAVEQRLGRGLEEDEVVLIGRMLEARKTNEEIFEVLDRPVVMPVEEDSKTYRYEASGSGVSAVPEPKDETE